MPCECDHKELVTKMAKTLYGNGEPEKALLVVVSNQQQQLRSIERRTTRIERMLWAVAAAILLAVLNQFLDLVTLRIPVPMPVPVAVVGESP